MRASAGRGPLGPAGGEEEWRGYLDGCPVGSQNGHTCPVHTNEGTGSRLVNDASAVCFPILTPAPRPESPQGSPDGSGWAGCRGPKASYLLTGHVSAAHRRLGLLPGPKSSCVPGAQLAGPRLPASFLEVGGALPPIHRMSSESDVLVWASPALPPQHMRCVDGRKRPPGAPRLVGAGPHVWGGASQAELAPRSPGVWETGSEAGAWPCGLGGRT